jgi:hypothetical protein
VRKIWLVYGQRAHELHGMVAGTWDSIVLVLEGEFRRIHWSLLEVAADEDAWRFRDQLA